MRSTKSLSHTTWECKYHVVWIPKCRRKVITSGMIYRGVIYKNPRGTPEKKNEYISFNEYGGTGVFSVVR